MVQTELQLINTLDNLFKESKIGKSFTGILELITNEQTIMTAIHNVKANKGSKTPGVDGKTINHYLKMEKHSLIDLVRKSFSNYKPKPVKRIYIPKDDGKKERPLGIPTMLDRILQECIRIVIEPILEGKFFDHSYGYRPYRATSHAVARLVHMVNHKKYWAIEGDIKGFFDNVNHRILINKLKAIGVIDKRILAIIKKMLQAGLLDDGCFHRTDKGTPQGGILSPLLANAYLNDFDWTIARMFSNTKVADRFDNSSGNAMRNAQRYLKQHGVLPRLLTRYADDWVIQTQTEEEANKLLRCLEKYFKHKLKIELSMEKTSITDCRKKPIKFMGFCIIADRKRNSDKLVGKNYPNPDKVKKQIRKLLNYVDKAIKQNLYRESLSIQIEKINAKIVGIANYWKSGVAKRVLGKIDHHVNTKLYFCSASKSGGGYLLENVPIHQLHNRPNRHLYDEKGKKLKNKRINKTYAVRHEGMLIGVTHAAITGIKYGEKLRKGLTPYTKEGRELFYNEKKKKNPPMARTPLYDEVLVELNSTSPNRKDIYNFEFYMNREYAYNQQLKKGKFICPACKEPLVEGNRSCHHKNPNLPIEEVNKVKNLVWLCNKDHLYADRGIPENIELPKPRKKYIKKLNKIKNQNK